MKKYFLAILMAIGLSGCGEDFARKLEQQDIMLPDSLKYVEVTEGFKPLYDQLSYSSFKPRDFKILHVKSPLGSGPWYFQLQDIETGVYVHYINEVNCGTLNANIGDVINLDIKLVDYPVNPNKETNRMKAGIDLAGFERNCSPNNDGYITDM